MNKVLFPIFFILSFFSLRSQNLLISLTNSTTEVFAVSDIRSIKFGPQSMFINRYNGSVHSWNINDIQSYSFTSTASIDSSPDVNTDILIVYPNPASDILTMSYSSTQSGLIKVDVYDDNGRLVHELFNGVHTGVTEVAWKLIDEVSTFSGNFTVIVSMNNRTISRSIIIQ
jgi:hypothetical protein